MKAHITILLLMIFSSPLTSCNTDEKKFTEFNTRIEKISLLADSYKSDNSDYLKTLIDSIKIIKNEYSTIKFDSIFNNQLEEKINVITSQIKRKISKNCTINRTFEMEINNLDGGFNYNFRLDFSILKDNKCEVRLYIKPPFEDWVRFNHFIKFKSEYNEDQYLSNFLNENTWTSFLNEDVKVVLYYETYNDSTLRINMKNYPILLKIKDFNDCECELSRVKYTESRKNISRKYTAPLSGDNRPVIKY